MKKAFALAMVTMLLVCGMAWAEESTVEKVMEIKNEQGELSHNCFIEGDTANYSLWGYIYTADAKSLWQDLKILETRNIKKLNVYINSGGGNGFAGMAMTDSLRIAINNGFVVKTYAMGMCASAAVPVYLAGQERVTSKNTLFMIHEGRLFKHYASETLKDIDAQREMLEMSEDQYVSWLVERTNLDQDTIEDYIKETTWFSAEQALEWGFADTVE